MGSEGHASWGTVSYFCWLQGGISPGSPKVFGRLPLLLECYGLGSHCWIWGLLRMAPRNSQVVLVVKKPPANAGDIRISGSVPGSGRSPGGGHGNLLQYSCLENPMDRGAWQATVHKVTKSWTWLKWLSMHILKIHNMWNSNLVRCPLCHWQP